MTTEEKAKAYDKAIERAREWYNNPNSSSVGKAYLYAVFPELKENEDERMCNIAIYACKYMVDNFENSTKQYEDAIAWLEKQGNKLADTVEPKFKVGDWIVFNGLVLFIKEVVQGYYRTISVGGIPNSYDWDIDNVARLWTIQDAKDGDVLAEDSCIFIIQKLGDNSTAAKTYCTLYNDGDFDDGSILYFDIDSTKPATKEQHELLFQKMREAGYEWDEDKKELRKIEHKITESEDEVIRKRLINICQDAILYETLADYTTKGFEECLAWLKKKGQQKWNDEDDTILLELIRRMEALDHYWNRPTDEKIIDWLKSLKERYTWKPSDEQIKAIRLARSFVVDDFGEHPTLSEILMELEEQLQKIKENKQ